MYNDRGERVQRVQGVAKPNLTITNKTFTHFATVSKKCTKMKRKKRLKEKYISIRMLSWCSEVNVHCSRLKTHLVVQDVGWRRMFKMSDVRECSRCRMKENVQGVGWVQDGGWRRMFKMADEEECSRWRMKKNVQDGGWRRIFKMADEEECSRRRMKENVQDVVWRRIWKMTDVDDDFFYNFFKIYGIKENVLNNYSEYPQP